MQVIAIFRGHLPCMMRALSRVGPMEIQEQSLKERLWHHMRADLARYVPAAATDERLMCCTCGRFLPFGDFSLEHIIPQQSLKDDPEEVKAKVFKNIRAGTMLLCTKPLKIEGKNFHGAGCNSFKGKFYDSALRSTLNRSIFDPKKKQFTSQHQVALFAAAYLAMVEHYGYGAVLTEAGREIRRQFFAPNKFNKTIPVMCQIVLMDQSRLVPLDGDLSPWETPFAFSIEERTCVVGFRGLVISLPISRHPEMPVVQHLQFVPQRFALRPDFSTFFD